MYKLILANGQEIDGLKMNGSTLVSETEVTNEMLSDEALESVRLIETDEQGQTRETVYRYAQTNGVFLKEDGYNFSIWGAGPAEIRLKELEKLNQMLIDAMLEMSEVVYDG